MRRGSFLPARDIFVVMGLLALALGGCSSNVPVKIASVPVPQPPQCQPGQATVSMRTSEAGEVLIQASVAPTGICQLALPVALEIDDSTGAALALTSSPATLSTFNPPGSQGSSEVDWIWNNWCGDQTPPFQARVRGPQGQVYATHSVDAAPACTSPLEVSKITAVTP
ncbi:MAG: hypothetical protein J2P45_11875 [Candidatus Dormibacteraeota bacterium]|nr:hypothetical protein [Candidatus Dormibacteraeota bacterium]